MMKTGFRRLEQNLMDVIKESQIKLGFDYGALQLFYPLKSLNHTFRTEFTEEEMMEYLKQFQEYTKERLGEVEVANRKGRFSFLVPAEGVKYVHEHVEDSPFLIELVKKTGEHGCTLEDVVEIFRKYSDHVVYQEMTDEEFDCLVYFEDEQPDDYYYCLHMEGEHVIYHRFKREDYEF